MRTTLSVLCLAAAMAVPASAGWSQTERFEISDQLVVMSHWTVRMPFAASDADPLVIGEVIDPMWGWIE